MKTEKTKSKPLILAMRETETELVNTVNRLMSENNLPCYFLEIIIDKIHRQLKDGAKTELAQASENYYRPITEDQKPETEEVST